MGKNVSWKLDVAPICINFRYVKYYWTSPYLVYDILTEVKIFSFWGAWVAQFVERPSSAQVMISRPVNSSHPSSSVRTAQTLELALDSVSPSLCPSLAHALSLSLSKINIKKIHIFSFYLSLFILRKKETDRQRGCEQERGRERENSKQAPHCQRKAHGDSGLDFMNHEITSWAKIKSQMLNPLSHPGVLR